MSLSLDATLCLRTAGTARFVALINLRLIAACDNYSEVTLADGSRIVLRKTLKSWEDTLPATHFLRVHRRLIVNLASIVRYERNPEEHTHLYLADVAKPVSASRRTWTQLRTRLARLHVVP